MTELRLREDEWVAAARVALPGGRTAVLRPGRADDAAAVAVLHARCGPRTLRDRYLASAPRLTSAVLSTLLMPVGGCSTVAVTGDGQVIGIAQIAPTGGTAAVELALVVRDDHQHLGLGEALARYAARAGLALGHTEMTACGAADNRRLARLVQRLGLAAYARAEDGLLTVRAPLAALVAPGVGARSPDRAA